MAVYNEKGEYKDWANKLNRDFSLIVDDFINNEYGDKSPEDLIYVMLSSVRQTILRRNIDRKAHGRDIYE